ncbi:MAG: DUF4012 domain-containing protein, partial [Nakamurella sp.]
MSLQRSSATCVAVPADRDDSGPRPRRIGWLGPLARWALLSGILLALLLGWVGWHTYQAYGHLQAAGARLADLQGQLRDITAGGTADGASQSAAALQVEAAAARSAVDDPLYRVATMLPFVGPNLDAIGRVARTVDSLAIEAVPPLIDVTATLQPAQLMPTAGQVDLASVERVAAELRGIGPATEMARSQIAAIDRTAVLQPIGDAVSNMSDRLDQAVAITEPAARYTQLLPAMLGADRPRNYLVVFQNPAEPRATGGIFGSYAAVTADRGKLTITDQGSSARSLLIFDPPAATLTADESTLFGPSMATYPQDANATPDFPTAAAMFVRMYQLRGGGSVDGVLAIDPVALSYLLQGAPAIDVGDGISITSGNLVSTLLSTVYRDFPKGDQRDRDKFLADATGLIFSRLMSGGGDPGSIVRGLGKAVGERRVLLWSNDPAEEAEIGGTAVSGAITGAGAPSLGVFLNDRTGAKLGFYLRNEVDVAEGSCRPDGRRELLVHVTLHYTAPASGLPRYVLGITDVGQAYRLRTDVLLYAPAGGIVVSAENDGAPVDLVHGADH